jgi:AbrB family looped-hinge helix DNA binding protein
MHSDDISKPTVKFRVKVSYVGSSFRVTIPKPIAEALKLKAGETIHVHLDGSKIIMERG